MQYFKFPYLGPAPDGTERMLRYDLNVLCQLEESLGGVSIYEALNQRAGLNLMRHLLWAGLKWQDPRLTPTRVGEMIQTEVIDKGADLELVVMPTLEALRKSGVLGVFKAQGPNGAAGVELSERPILAPGAVAADVDFIQEPQA